MDERFELLGPTGSITGVRTTPVYRQPSSKPSNGAGDMEVDKPAQSIERPAASSFSMVPYGTRTFPSYDNAFACIPKSTIDLSSVSGSITSIANGSDGVFDELSALIKRKSVLIALKAQFMSVEDKIDMVNALMKRLPNSNTSSIVIALNSDTDGVLAMHAVDGTQTSMQEYTGTMVSAMSDDSSPCTWSVNVFMVIQLMYVLFTGRNCYTPTAGFLDEFAKVQSKYRSAIGKAAKLVGAPLDAAFVCRDLATTLYIYITTVSADMLHIPDKDVRMSMITTAIMSGIRFVEAGKINQRRLLAEAQQSAAIATKAYKNLTLHVTTQLDEDD